MDIKEFTKAFKENKHRKNKEKLREELSDLKSGVEELMKELDINGIEGMEHKLGFIDLEEQVSKIYRLTGNLESEFSLLRHIEEISEGKKYEYTGFDDCNGEPIRVDDIVMDIEITDRVIGKIIKEDDEYYMSPNGDLDRMVLNEDLAEDLEVVLAKE